MNLKLLQMDYGSPKHRPVCLSIETLQHVLIGTMNAEIHTVARWKYFMLLENLPSGEWAEKLTEFNTHVFQFLVLKHLIDAQPFKSLHQKETAYFIL